MMEGYGSGNDNSGDETDTMGIGREDEETVEKAAETEARKTIDRKVSYWCYDCGQDLGTRKAYEDHMANQMKSTDGKKGMRERTAVERRVAQRRRAGATASGGDPTEYLCSTC